MLNILIISDEAKDIYALFKSAGFAPDMHNSKTEPVSSKPGSLIDDHPPDRRHNPVGTEQGSDRYPR